MTNLLPIFLVASLASAQTKPSLVEVQVKGSTIELTPQKGYHLNTAAPASLVNQNQRSLNPEEKTEQRFVFKSEEAAGWGKLHFYVCDDASTFCEPKTEEVQWGTSGTAAATSSSKSASAALPPEYKQALATAKGSKKLVLLDFAASWCPPCLRLDHEVFPTAEFKKATKDYIFLHVDVDRENNYALMQQFSIKAFPSLVVVNAQGEELKRFLDFQEAKPLARDLTELSHHRPLSLAKTMSSAERGDAKAEWAMAESRFAALDYEEAVDWYERSLGPHYREAKVSLWSARSNDDKTPASLNHYREVLREVIAAEPESFQSMEWRLSLAESLGEKTPEAQTLLHAVVSLAQKWIDEPKWIEDAHRAGLLTEIKDLEKAEVEARLSQAEEMLGNRESARSALVAAADEVRKLKPTEATPTQIIYLVGYMKKTSDPQIALKEIEPWYEKLEKAYPKEYTYYYRHAKLLFDRKELPRATELAQKAFDLSYGNNRFSTAMLLSEIELAFDQKENTEKARQVLTSLLATPEAQAPRNQRASAAAKELLAKIKS